mmetsp:Transcript_95315/g.227039  ORF Transcript_95315/g.227039 Transcript_95315/m.227039 type:complete len:285 (-) Transcript_95315:297-1151(-)
MLVLPFQVEIYGRAQVVFHVGPGRARVEPDVHGVGPFLVEVGRVSVLLRQQFGHGKLVPGVAALLLENAPHVADHLGSEERLAIILAIEGRDGHAPSSLPGDAPVATTLDHRSHAVGLRLWNERDLVDGVKGILPEAVDAGKPLRGGTCDDGLLAAPVIGILVRVRLLAEEQRFGVQHLRDAVVGILQHVRTDEAFQANFVGEVASIIHGRGNLKAVLLAHDVVICAVARRSVDQPGSRLSGDVVASHDQRSGLAADGMLVVDALEVTSVTFRLNSERCTEHLL